MTRDEFLRALESQLDLAEGTLHESQSLTDVEGWDSMATVLFIGLADEHAGVIVSGERIDEAKTVNDLLSLLGDGLTK